MSVEIPDRLFDDFCNGVEQSLVDMMQKLAPKVYSFINNIIKSELDAEEFTQDVFVKLWNNRSKIENKKALNGFVFAIARNVALDYFKKKSVDCVELTERVDVGDFAPTAESIYLAKEYELWVMLLVEKLPEQQRKIFEMSHIRGMSRDEIAAQLNITPKTVSNNLSIIAEYIRNAIALVGLFFHADFLS